MDIVARRVYMELGDCIHPPLREDYVIYDLVYSVKLGWLSKRMQLKMLRDTL